MTVKFAVLVALPLRVMTEICPVVAPAGTIAVICVELLTVNVANVPLKATEVVPTKFVPLMVTTVPTGPEVGENDVIVGATGAVTVNFALLRAVPFTVTTKILPVFAPVGTLAVI